MNWWLFCASQVCFKKVLCANWHDTQFQPQPNPFFLPRVTCSFWESVEYYSVWAKKLLERCLSRAGSTWPPSAAIRARPGAIFFSVPNKTETWELRILKAPQLPWFWCCFLSPLFFSSESMRKAFRKLSSFMACIFGDEVEKRKGVYIEKEFSIEVKLFWKILFPKNKHVT